MGTATRFYNKAQGRSAHPGFILLHGCTPTGFHKSLTLCNPVGVGCLKCTIPRVRSTTLGFAVKRRWRFCLRCIGGNHDKRSGNLCKRVQTPGYVGRAFSSHVPRFIVLEYLVFYVTNPLRLRRDRRHAVQSPVQRDAFSPLPR